MSNSDRSKPLAASAASSQVPLNRHRTPHPERPAILDWCDGDQAADQTEAAGEATEKNAAPGVVVGRVRGFVSEPSS